mmetsp:Transcript_3255/g.11832  ORF Transcript_3255/g.11832 Transcript_3255/m.11832 type:complete len:343 (-) Transcript_3255:268-1296(-)
MATEQPPRRADRPARRQVDSPVYSGTAGAAGEVYNIWYHKHAGGREFGNINKRKHKAVTKCNLDLDSGYTRGDDQRVPYICLHFARGCCFKGEECTYLHRKPTRWDQARLDLTHDIFGRERHREDRDDMGGVGCMHKPNKTVYVHFGGAATYGYEKLQQMIRKTFAQYGTIESLSVKMQKTIAFVTYDIRASAEFAKECLANQSLLGSTADEVLDVRWSYDDANPRAVMKRKRELEEQMASAVQKKIDSMPESERVNHNLEASGHYPSTQDAVEDDIDRYLDDDPYYDFTEEEEEEEGDKKEEVEAAGNAGASKSQTAQEQSEKGGASNALGLLGDYESDSD